MRKRKFSHDSEQFYTLTAFIGTERVRGSQELLIKMIINFIKVDVLAEVRAYYAYVIRIGQYNHQLQGKILYLPNGCLWFLEVAGSY